MIEWLEDELTLAERFALGFHLADCPGCRAYVGELQASVGVGAGGANRGAIAEPITEAAVERRSRPRTS